MGPRLEFLVAVLLVITTITCVKSNDGIVVFNAVRVAHIGPVPENTIIPFDTVTLNIGGAYDADTGLFTAPVDGIYQITWSVKSNEDPVWVHLKVNDKTEGEIGTRPPHGIGSSTRILDLKKGDQVGARFGSAGKHLFCNSYRACAFNGHLLYAHSYNLRAPGSDD